MSTIIEKLVELGTSLSEGFHVLYADRSEQNLDDDKLFPLLAIDPIKSNDTPHKTGAMTSEYQLSMFFGKKSQLDWTTLQHETECNAPMRLAARKMITLLQNDNFFRSVGSSSRQDVKNVFDVNISGCLLTVNVTVMDATSICNP